MRLARLDLLRYGRFTDRILELPGQEQDFHMVVGPNEAGKSTALSAIEDLLFGIPSRSLAVQLSARVLGSSHRWCAQQRR